MLGAHVFEVLDPHARELRGRHPRAGRQRHVFGCRRIQLGRGEPIKDTARVMGRMLAGAVIRTFAQREVEDFAAYSRPSTRSPTGNTRVKSLPTSSPSPRPAPRSKACGSRLSATATAMSRARGSGPRHASGSNCALRPLGNFFLPTTLCARRGPTFC